MQHVEIHIVLKKRVDQVALRVDGFVLFNHQSGEQEVGNHKQHD